MRALPMPRSCRVKAHKPYEFGVKVSIATTLKTILPEIEAHTGAALKRILADAGYKGHKASVCRVFSCQSETDCPVPL